MLYLVGMEDNRKRRREDVGADKRFDQCAFRTDDGRLFFVNVGSERGARLLEAVAHSGRIGGMQVVELGRFRLNPYVGSPVWSDWTTIGVI